MLGLGQLDAISILGVDGAVKTTLQCPRCSARRIWNVRNAVEHSEVGPVPLGQPQGLNPLEACICADCGFTVWYAAQPRRLAPDPEGAVVELDDHRLRCESCRSRDHLLVARFEEVEHSPSAWVVPLAVLHERGVASGTFAVVICRDCGRLTWFACEFSSEKLPHLEHGCLRCSAAALVTIDPVEEVGGHKLPIAIRGRREIGRFRLEVCVACGATDWFGEHFGRLRADGRDILLLEGTAKPAPARDKTPYR